MYLMRLGQPGAERPALRTGDGTILDLSPVTDDIDAAFLAGDGPSRARDAAAAGRLPTVDASGLRIGAPIARPGAVICVGQNYAAHAAESGAAPPTSPDHLLQAPQHRRRPR